MMKLTINANIMMAITIAIILLIVIITVVAIVYRKKDQKEVDELLTDLRKDRKEKEVIKELEKEEKKLKQTSIDSKEAIIEKESVLVDQKITNDEEKTDPNLSSISPAKSDIESMLEHMQEDLDKQPNVTEFENEQEEKAIISYQELVDSIKNKSPKVEVVDDEFDGTRDQMNDQLEETKEHIVTMEEKSPVSKLVNKEDKAFEKKDKTNENLEFMEYSDSKTNQDQKHFKSTDFISPVYGKMKDHLEYPTVPSFEKERSHEKHVDFNSTLEDEVFSDYTPSNNLTISSVDDEIIPSLEQTLHMPPISPEIKKNDEFLQALKEFRKNLD